MFRNFELTELKVLLSNLQSRHWAQGLPQGLLQKPALVCLQVFGQC